MNIEIEKITSNIFNWNLEYDGIEYSGSLELPSRDERGHVIIEWDESDVPDNWEEIESQILTKVYNEKC